MVVAAFPAHGEIDVPKDTLDLTMIPVHAGAYRAFKELGLQIPPQAVPPEVKK
jgi:TRAP-type uncharacterized transport system substrate-binding protein